MHDSTKLSRQEREALDELRKRLEKEGGLRISNEKFLMALLQAAAQLPEEDLLRLLKQGIEDSKLEGNPGK